MGERPNGTDLAERRNGRGGEEHCNEVFLVGRLSRPAEERALPSGDRIAAWRLVVERAAGGSGSARQGATVDTVDCVAWPAALRRRVQRWAAGDTIKVEGSLRRRFWRSAGGVSSRYEVEVNRLRRVARASP